MADMQRVACESLREDKQADVAEGASASARGGMRENEALTREYLGYLAERGGDEAGRRAAWERMGQGTAFYHGLPCAFSYVPRLFGPATRALFEDVANTTYSILAKIIREYRANPAYRAEFRFDPRVEELVLLPQGYEEPLPVARIDFVFDEETGVFHFVEFNTDSSSGMNESFEALNAVRETEPFHAFAAQHAIEDDVKRQFDDWVDAFAKMYAASEGAAARAAREARAARAARVARAVCAPRAACAARATEGEVAAAVADAAISAPQVAIVACLDSPDPEIGELEAFRELFERKGMPCSVFDVRQLEFDGERLVGRKALAGASNVAIDCVWRFCIVVDLLEHWDDVQPFIEAVRQRKVEIIGSFATQIVHDKQLFAVLRRPATQALLTPEERAFVAEHVPATWFLDDPDLDVAEVRSHPESWVVKPSDWYASKNVIAGLDYDAEEWAQLVDERLAQKTHQGISPFLAQEFHVPYKTQVVALYGEEGDFTSPPRSFGNIIGVFLHAGSFGGVYVRQGPYGVIGSARAGLVAPVLWVND